MDSSGANAAGPSTSAPSIPPNDPRLARCGFAKLQGDGIEFFVRKYEIVMGRTSKNSNLDLILGDSTTISRQHAAIKYNFDAKCFELVVLGKNGVTVESSGSGTTHLYTPESPPTPLRSRDLLIMGEKKFYFLLPRAMGGTSRKRRRLEPSPAPGAVPNTTMAPSAVPAAAAAALPQAALNVPSSQQAQQPLHGVSEASAAGGGGFAAVPAAAQLSADQVHVSAQAQPQHQQQQPVHEHIPVHGSVAEVSAGLAVHPPQPQAQQQQQQSTHHAYQMQQDDDDALISAGGLPYDNGTSYGYGTENDGFPGAF